MRPLGGQAPAADFYPRPHMEGDEHTIIVPYLIVRFLPTPSHGGRLQAADDMYQAHDFYPRPHMKGDRRLAPKLLSRLYFYPRPHMEGDRYAKHNEITLTISTHAFTWRAT